MELKETRKFKLENWKTYLIYVVIIVVLYYVLKNEILKLFAWLKGLFGSSAPVSDNLTYDVNEYVSFATTINDSFGFWSDNLNNILAVFTKMVNIDDVKKLNLAYNQKFGKDLRSVLYDEFTQNDVGEINAVLMTNNINYTY